MVEKQNRFVLFLLAAEKMVPVKTSEHLFRTITGKILFLLLLQFQNLFLQ